MVTNRELESQFKAFSEDYEETKNTLNQLCEKVEELSTMKETLPELEVAILALYPDRMATYQELKYSKLEPSLGPPLLAKIAPVTSSKSDGCNPAKLLPRQPQLHFGSITQDAALKKETQLIDSPQVQIQEQPKERITRTIVTTTEH